MLDKLKRFLILTSHLLGNVTCVLYPNQLVINGRESTALRPRVLPVRDRRVLARFENGCWRAEDAKRTRPSVSSIGVGFEEIVGDQLRCLGCLLALLIIASLRVATRLG